MKILAIVSLLVLFFSGSLAAQVKGDAAAGKIKYQMLCVSCHGATGKGDGPAATALTPKPRNFTEQAVMSKKTDADLKKVIQQGGTAAGLSPSMPPWGAALSEQDVANVIAFIRTLK